MKVNINSEYTNKDFGDALRELMEIKDWSYSQLSYRTELTASYLNQIVNKKKNPPNTENIKKIAKAFNIKPEYFKDYRVREITDRLLFNKDDYDIPLSDKEAEYLARLIEKHYHEKKSRPEK